ncbi:MAG TPA: choice-of-anchor D domain-containing protein [Solirubrobacterales bacterium]|nr:choice-of-anchor D domain-containing protein [Solirubrobacterales bacterium]
MDKPTAQPRPFGTTVLFLLALALAALALPASALAAPEEGNGTLSPAVSPIVLPTTTVNYQSPPQSVLLGYEGEGEVSINKITIEGEEAGEFFSNGSNCGNLGDGQQCEAYVGSKPGNLGEHHAWLTVVYNGLRPEDKFAISNRGVAPQLTVEPASYDFGLARANRETLFETLQVTNTGEAEVGFNYVNFQAPGENVFWTDNGGSTCWGSNLQPGQSCALRVAFNPHQRIAYSAEMQVFANNTPAVAGTATVSGEGGGATVAATENPVDFGVAGAGSTGTVRTITLENTGNMSEGFFIGVIAGGDSGSFELIGEHCTMHELQPGQSCTAQVRFHPAAPGSFSAHLAFFGDGEGGVLIQLEGEGVGGAAGVAPGSFDFGPQAVRTRSFSHAFAISNAGSTPLDFDHVSIGGTDLDQFVVSGDECSGETLAPGGECQVRVRFNPDSVGVKQAVLKVYGSAPVVVAALSGTGTEPLTAGLGTGPVGQPGPGPSAAPVPAAKQSKRAKHRRFGRNATIAAPAGAASQRAGHARR